MYDQVYRYLDLPGQVCENTAIISKKMCVISAITAQFLYNTACVLKVSHTEVWEAGTAV